MEQWLNPRLCVVPFRRTTACSLQVTNRIECFYRDSQLVKRFRSPAYIHNGWPLLTSSTHLSLQYHLSVTMADVRALLAAERQSRRINHPALTYTKSGALICNICQLNVKSESLWEGHLRSANHKKNAKAAQELPSKSLKRRRDDDEDEDQGPRIDVDLDRRKIPKSRAASLAEKQAQVTFQDKPEIVPAVPPVPTPLPAESEPVEEVVEPVKETASAPVPAAASEPPAAPDSTVDEDEWAAFERDIAPLAQPPAPTGAAPDYSAATISAAPVSAAQLAEQQAEDKRKLAELAAEDEQEDERGRLEEEFEIMEDMEERVRRLKEMREKLRAGVVAEPRADAGDVQMESDEGTASKAETKAEQRREEEDDDDDDDDDDSDPDDWYH